MPHQCVACNDVFPDGSDEILSGCDCGGNKFEFVPETATSSGDEQPETPEASTTPTVAATSQPYADDSHETTSPPSSHGSPGEIHEDEAQHAARSGVVSPDELPSTSLQSKDSLLGTNNESAEADQVEAIREELNRQFESIKIVSPGTYELNLMELYEQQDYIISLYEDGQYAIHMDGYGIAES